LENDLQLLDGRLNQFVAKKPATPLLFSHPVYDYLIKRYGIHAKSVHWEPDQKPTADQLSELLQILKNHRARWMVWEGEPAMAAVEELDEMSIDSIVYNPCGNIPKDGDFLSVMQQNVSNLETVFR
jgi:zinc transport system substrate-binding protein